MGIEYYAFSLFIAGLLCLIAILCKLLFADVKRQKKLLDEKETKLLRLFQTIEELMEEFNDQVNTAMNELKEHEKRIEEHTTAALQLPAPPVNAVVPHKEPVKPERPETAESGRLRAASEVLARAELMVKNDGRKKTAVPAAPDKGTPFQRIIDELADEPLSIEQETPIKKGKNSEILALKESGKSVAQIAQELGITQNEVQLVIDIAERK